MEWLAQAVGHADRTEPLRNYCTGLLLDGERKSVEPMATRLAPDHVQRMHESLHHFVAQSPWSDADMLRQVRTYVLPAMENGPRNVCCRVQTPCSKIMPTVAMTMQVHSADVRKHGWRPDRSMRTRSQSGKFILTVSFVCGATFTPCTSMWQP